MATAPIVIDKGVLTDVLPATMRKQLTPETFEAMTDLNEDVQVLESYRDNLIGHTHVLKSGNYNLRDYSNACRFVTFQMLGDNQKTAYIRTFPDRYKEFKAKGFTAKQISARTSMYAKGKLVLAIQEAAHVPVWLANAHSMQRAVNQQVYLMEHAESERVQCDAANSVMTHLKRPEALKVEHSTEEATKSVIGSLLTAAENIVNRQMASLSEGTTAKQIINEKLIEDSNHE